MDKPSPSEHIRKRPGMYIGGTDLRGLHHLAFELLGNSIDQYLHGSATRVSIQFEDETVTVTDDGIGLPFEKSSQIGNDSRASDYFLTMHHTSSKDNHAPHVHFATPLGVGLIIVAALAEELTVESFREGKLYRQTFSRGIPTSGVSSHEMATPFFADQSDCRGTRVTFKADPEIFPDHKLNPICLRGRVMDAAHLYPGLFLELQQERFHSPRGLADLALTDSASMASDCFYLDCVVDDVAIQAAAHGRLRKNATGTLWKTWANGVRTRYVSSDGTHHEAFMSALEEVGWRPRVAFVHVIMQEPRYAGPTKEKLDVPDKEESIRKALLTALLEYCEQKQIGKFKSR